MSTKQIPVVGEPFKDYAKGQIDQRQKVYGSGFNNHRTSQQISYLNSRTSWIKLASSVSVEESYKINHIENSSGIELAKKGVLFNGISQVNTTNGGYTFKSGVATSNSNINNSAYGFGGTDFGLVPMPGIVDFEVRHENRGSIRTATLNIKAFNKTQFDIIEILYLRLGFTCLIEWGHSKVLNNTGEITNPPSTLIDQEWWGNSITTNTHLGMLTKIESKRKSSNGNYDALFSRVVNYSWTFGTDGSYDIKIYFASLGDVVESFKMSTLSPNIQEATYKDPNATDDKKNINSIHQILKDLEDREVKNPSTVFNTGPNSDLISLASTQNKQPDPGLVDSLFGINQTLDPSSTYYIRLGYLTQLIWQKQMTYIKNGGGNCFPLIDVDLSSFSWMNAIENLISIDPRVCIIKPEFNFKRKIFEGWYFDPDNVFKIPNNLFAPFYVPQNNLGDTLGIINNIYLNFDFLKKISKSNTDSKGNLSLYNFYTSLLNGINKSFCNICNLELNIDEENNNLIIRDENVTVGIDPDCNPYPKQTTNQSGEIEIFGYNNGTSNFVKNYTIETQITNDLKNQLSIGATSNGNIVNEDSTAFSKWNKGLKDRFQEKATTGVTDKCKIDEPATPSLPQIETAQSDTVGTTTVNTGLISQNPKTKEDDFEKILEKTIEAYLDYIKQNLTTKKDSTSTITSNIPYFFFDDDVVETGKSLLKNYLITVYEYNLRTNDRSSSLIGFIPINLTLELDGLSGLKIYNELTIDQKFLPHNYPNIMKFIITGVDHKLSENDWTTSIKALSKPTSALTLSIPTPVSK